MSTVDERIVNMKIDNKQLLSGVKSTTDALSSLNKSVDSIGKSGSMSSLGGAVDAVKTKFGALNVAAMTAVATITNKLVNAGISLVKSMTLDPIMAGFREYETNLNSVQTIMANTGEKVGVVNKYLSELNAYSDQTIYNFSQMASAIGKFTSAGVGLKTATSAIKGMANVAALSGANAEQLNSAMYQMSQALASGKITLMDWNSLVNASMGGKNLQNSLKATAESFGTNVDGMIAEYGSFRDSLTQGAWLTTRVFNQTMRVFAGNLDRLTGETKAYSVAQLEAMGYSKEQAKDLHRLSKASMDSATKIKTFSQMMDVVKESIGSGWSAVFMNIFGNFNEAKKLWTTAGTQITDVIHDIFAVINGTLIIWKKRGGFDDVWAGIGNIFQALRNILRPFLQAFGLLGPGTKNAGKGLASLSEGFRQATKWLVKLTAGTGALTPIFEIIGSVFGAVLAVVVGVVRYFAALVPLASGLATGFASLVSDVGALVMKFLEWADIAGKIETFFTKVIEGREGVFKPLLDTIGAIVAAFGTLLQGDVEGFKSQFRDALTLLDPLMEKIQTAGAFLQGAFAKFQGAGIFGTIAGYLSTAAGKVQEFATAVRGAFDAFTDAGGSAATATAVGFTTAAGGAADGGTRLVEVFKAVGTWIKDAAVAIGGGIKEIAGSIGTWLSGIEKIDIAMLFGTILNSAILIVAYQFIKSLRDIFGGFKDIGTNAAGAFEQLTGTLKTMQNAVKAHMILNIAIAIGILAGSLWLLSKIPMPKLVTGLAALYIMFKMLDKAMQSLAETAENDAISSGKIIAMAGAMVLLSMAMLNMAGAVAILGNMELKTLVKGLGAIAVTMFIMVKAVSAMAGVEKQILASAAAMLIMSIALQAMAAAIFLYSKMDWDTFIFGLLKMAVALKVMVMAVTSLPEKKVVGASIAMGILATSMIVLAGALKLFATMSWEEIAKGLIALGGALLIMVVAANALKGATGGVLALSLLSTTMVGLASALKILGSMDLASIGKAILALAAAMVVFIAAGFAAQFVAPGLIVLGAAIALIGAGMMMAGVGMAAFGAGLAILVGLGTAAFGVITGAIQVLLAMLPLMAIQAAAAFVTFIETIAAASPRIAAAFEQIVGSMLDSADRMFPRIMRTFNLFLDGILKSVQKNAPKFGKTWQVLLDTGLKVLEFSIPRMAKAGLNIIESLLRAIANRIPRIATLATDIVVGFINGIANHINRVVTAGTNLIIKFIDGIGKNSVRLADAAAKTLTDFLNGLADVIRNRAPEIRAAGWNVASAIIDGMVGGLGDMGDRVWNAAMDLARGLPKVVQKALGIASPSKVFYAIGGYVGQGLHNGLVASNSLVSRASEGLAYSTIDAAKTALDSHSPSRVFQDLGIDVGKGFVAGIVSQLKAVAAAGAKMATYAVDTVSKTVTAMQFKADAQAARAEAYRDAAAELRRKARNKKLSKEQKKALNTEAKRLQKRGKEAQKQASATQATINAEAKRKAEAKRFEEADAQGKADILTKRAEDAANAAARDRESAIALAKQADLIRKRDAKRAAELEKKAAKALKSAEAAANRAKSNAQQAAVWSAEAVVASAADIAKVIQDDRDAEALEERLKTMSDSEKAAYYQAEAQKAQAESDAKYAEAEALLAKAQAEAATNANQARKDVEAAAAAVAAAQAAADKAEQFMQDLESVTGGLSGGGSGGSFDPSAFKMPDVNIASSKVYGAQNMFDAYSKALAATAAAAAGDTAPSVQFVQNNTSPVALSPSEIYRQSKNLLSSVEQKLTSALT